MAFENYSTAQISIMSINFFTGFVFVLAYYVMNALPLTQVLAKQLVNFFRLFPGYLIGEGLISLSIAYLRVELSSLLGRPVTVNVFDWEVIGRSVTFLFIESIGYFLLVLLTEVSYLRRMLYALDIFRAKAAGSCPPRFSPPDEDVTVEEATVTASDPVSFSLYLKDIQKTYAPSLLGSSPKFAVRGMSIAIPVGERFGLLGINGAGKTTTLGILTGDIQPTEGEAYVAGLPLSNPSTRDHIGYCPQVDPLLELMTGYETLWFFGRIRGIDAVELQLRVDMLIDEVGLRPFASKPCGSYSGGNKRKLSLAVALIGDPSVKILCSIYKQYVTRMLCYVL
jgi:ATP-binding cassette subfamily A (ABC1) protein 3